MKNLKKIEVEQNKSSVQDVESKNTGMLLNFWLLENMRIMEELTVKEPVSWSEQDWGG